MEKLSQNSVGDVRIVIIGAGAAGLAAANRLYEAGFTSVRILEAQGRIGGRIFSNEREGSTEFFEYGAQWIHGEKHAIYEFAKANNLVLEKRSDSLIDEDEATGEFVLDCGRSVTEEEKFVVEECLQFLNDVLLQLETCVGLSEQEITDRNVGGIIKEKFNRFLDENGHPLHRSLQSAAYDWFLRYQLVDNSCAFLEDLSVKAFCDYGLDGDATVRLNVPMIRLLHLLSDKLPRSAVALNKPVAQIKFFPADSANPASVVCSDGETISVDHVLFTGSLGVLKSSYDLFHPKLSDRKRAAIDDIGFGSIVKVLLQFPNSFWDEDEFSKIGGFQMLWLEEVAKLNHEFNKEKPVRMPWQRSVLGFDTIKTAKNMLVMWLAGSAVAEVDALSDEAVGEGCWQLLCKFAQSDRVPKPLRVLREKWSINPYTRGTYSFYSLLSSQHGITIKDLSDPEWFYFKTSLRKNVPGLLFAGEATHPKFFSTIHGAALSGWREADRLINLYVSDQQL